MKLTPILLTMLLTISIHSAPSWVPENKVKSFDIVKAAAARLSQILKSKPVLSCSVKNGEMIFTLTRHDLKTTVGVKVPGAISCEIDGDDFEVETTNKATFGQCFLHSSVGMGLGFVAGVATCAAIR